MSATVYLQGGLGNQLFMAAALLGYCKKYNLKPIITYSYLDKNNKGLLYIQNVFSKFIVDDDYKLEIEYEENSSQWYEEIPFYVNKNVALKGYFQSELFFNNLDVSSYFKLPQVKLDNFTVGLHVRRTDYNQLGWTLPLSYYKNVLSLLDSINCDLIIFSDDTEWCVNNILPLCDKFNTRISSNKDELLDLATMNAVDVMVCANSTFSWWGAYLGKSKKVYVPDIWFTNFPYNKEIYIKDWIKVSIN